MAKRRGHRANLEGVVQEINLIPYLDIMVNLVLFMLVTITGFISFTILNASIPVIAPDSGKAQAKMQREQLLLIVRVTRSGFNVDANVFGGKSMKKAVIRKKAGQFDFELLNSKAIEIKNRFTEETRVLILAEPRVRYEDIIHTMDAMREKAAGGRPEDLLFPDVTLSLLSKGA